MQILTVDIGTGTQDILLFDSERTPENCLKLVVPSPTLLLSRQVAAATAAKSPLVITGVLMGGGPVSWAVEDSPPRGLPHLCHRRTLPAPSTTTWTRSSADLGVEFVDEAEAAAAGAARRLCARPFRRLRLSGDSRRPSRAFGLELRAGRAGACRVRPRRGAAGCQRPAVPDGLPGRAATRRPRA